MPFPSNIRQQNNSITRFYNILCSSFIHGFSIFHHTCYSSVTKKILFIYAFFNNCTEWYELIFIFTANKRSAFPLIIKEFEDSGYDVKYSILNSANYGVPQKRERVIIVGFRKDLKIDFTFPELVFIT